MISVQIVSTEMIAIEIVSTEIVSTEIVLTESTLKTGQGKSRTNRKGHLLFMTSGPLRTEKLLTTICVSFEVPVKTTPVY